MNKKAQSNLVAYVLIIGLAIIAIGTIFGFLTNFSENVLTSPASCSEFQVSNSLDFLTACYNETSSEVQIRLKRKGENPQIEELKFTLSFEGGTSEYICNDKCSNCKILGILETKNYYFTTEEIPQEIGILANDCLVSKKEITLC